VEEPRLRFLSTPFSSLLLLCVYTVFASQYHSLWTYCYHQHFNPTAPYGPISINMAIYPNNVNSSANLDNTHHTSTASSMVSCAPRQDCSRDDPPSPPPQPPPSPAGWNRLCSVRCVTRGHPHILTLRQARRPCAARDLNSGVNSGSVGK
jgi:hypothetical protein